MGSATGLLTRGSLPRRLPGLRQWLRGGGASPLTAAGPSRIRTGFPHRAPDCGRAYHRTVSGSFVATLAARPRVGGADLRLLVGARSRHRARRLGSRAAQARPRGRVRGPRRAARSRDRTRRARVRARDALRGERRDPPDVRRRAATGSPLDVAIDAVGRRRRDRRSGSPSERAASHDGGARARDRSRRARRHATALGRLARVGPRRARRRPGDASRGSRRGRGGARRRRGRQLARAARALREDHAPAYLRRDAATSAALRALAGGGRTLGVFTDAPEPLARVALAQLGAERDGSRRSRPAPARSSDSSRRSGPDADRRPHPRPTS